MEIIILSPENEGTSVQKAVQVLAGGGVVVLPTDTVYGLCSKATDASAIKKIFEIKKRSEEKSLPVFVKNVSEARKLAEISDEKSRILNELWPGAVTAIFYHKEKLPISLTGGKTTIAIRVPNHSLLKNILEAVAVPLAQTSANISGQKPAQTIEDLKNYFSEGKKPDLIIYAGEIKGEPSTIIDFTGEKPILVRLGAVSKEEFEKIFAKLN